MTDKQIIMKEITECGFYCSKDDTERLYIYEVIKNTDEEWLKENPEATLLIDEWLYDYTDYDDRKVYGTSGNLIDVCYASTCEVYKIEDTKYKIYGNSGQFLIEDKPTYKEQLKAKEQECKRLERIVAHCCHDILYEDSLQGQLDQLKAENDTLFKAIEEVNKINKKLKSKNEELKGQLTILDDETIVVEITEKQFEEYQKLKQALTEIKEIAEFYNNSNMDNICYQDGIYEILQKCEVEDE